LGIAKPVFQFVQAEILQPVGVGCIPEPDQTEKLYAWNNQLNGVDCGVNLRYTTAHLSIGAFARREMSALKPVKNSP
jgi:hypothetical protein